MSMLELFFAVSVVLPPTVVLIGAVLLMLPTHRPASQASTEHAHAH